MQSSNGELAQLGERLRGTQEVVGSSPIFSIPREHLIPLGYQVFFVFLLQQLKTLDNLMVSRDRKSTRLNSSHVAISYAVFCLKKKIVLSYVHIYLVLISLI